MQNEWISIKDRLPRKNGKYLCCDKDKHIHILSFAQNLYSIDSWDFAKEHRSGFYDYSDEYGYYEWDGVTHWMPLPEPPKEGAKNA